MGDTSVVGSRTLSAGASLAQDEPQRVSMKVKHPPLQRVVLCLHEVKKLVDYVDGCDCDVIDPSFPGLVFIQIQINKYLNLSVLTNIFAYLYELEFPEHGENGNNEGNGSKSKGNVKEPMSSVQQVVSSSCGTNNPPELVEMAERSFCGLAQEAAGTAVAGKVCTVCNAGSVALQLHSSCTPNCGLFGT